MTAAEAPARPASGPLPPAASLEDLLRGADAREPMLGGERKSGVRFERVVIGGERYVVKHLHCDEDWVARATGDLACRPVQLRRSGLLHQLPSCIDHAVVGCAGGVGRGGYGGALLCGT